MHRIEMNLETGEIKEVPLTDAEIAEAQGQASAHEKAQREARIAELEASLVPVPTREEVLAEIQRLRGEL
jgi:hypothetical protein